MTGLRHDGAPGGAWYEDTGEFAAAVGRLADPLSDPLPGRTAPAPVQPEQPPVSAPQGRGYGYGGPAPGPGPYAAPYGGYGAAPTPAPPQPRPQPPQPPQPRPQPQLRPEPERAAVPRPRPAQRSAQPPAAAPETAPAASAETSPDAPAPGGRAARRKAAAARHRGGHAPAASGAASGAAAAPRSRLEARRAARAARPSPGTIACTVLGEIFITIGLLMLLFVIYQLWWTNVLADEAASQATQTLEHQWTGKSGQSDANMPNHFAQGKVFAIIYLPKLDVEAPVAEGIDKDTILDKGEVGHYSGTLETAFPWDATGNFALAAHRNTHGEPFRYINRLVPGDKVVVETATTYYTYEITSSLPQTSPSNVSVIKPIPPGSGFTQPGRYITLTTCTPEFTSTYRLIVWGKMVGEQPRSKGAPAALTTG